MGELRHAHDGEDEDDEEEEDADVDEGWEGYDQGEEQGADSFGLFDEPQNARDPDQPEHPQ